ncbi:hypothetical protein HDU97_007989 [Phlyctochytrium planicorne]|nr:hypothetical protein HDU97_007989 [Phlyctochytrium planicorne]
MPYDTLLDSLLNDSPSPALILPRPTPSPSHLPPLRAFYSDLRAIVNQTALLAPFNAIRTGDRITLMAPTSMEFAVAFLTILKCGGSVNPVNPLLAEDEMKGLIERGMSRAILVSRGVDGDKLAVIRKLSNQLSKPLYETWTVANPSPGQTAGTTSVTQRKPAGISFSSSFEVQTRLISSAGMQVDSTKDGVPASRDTEALYLFTSGTTGRAKGVPLTHANILHTLNNIRDCYNLSAFDCTYLVMPLFHVHGLIGVFLSTLYSGGTVVMPPKFNSSLFWQDILEFGYLDSTKVTWYSAVPSIHQTLLTKAKDTFSGNTGKVRFIRSGSSSLSPATSLALERTFGAPVIEAYAMTETGHQIASNFLPPGIRKTSSVGKGRGVEVLILDDEGKPAKTNSPGDVFVRGENVFKGYDHPLDKGIAKFLDDPEGGPAWYRTGDYGYMDENQFIFLLGRTSELIHHNQEKVSPLEVEAALLQIDGVSEAVAFPFPPREVDANGVEIHSADETLQAAIVLHPRSRRHVTESSLMEFAKAVLPASRVPQRIYITDVIPKTATGKLKRAMVSKYFYQTSPGASKL